VGGFDIAPFASPPHLPPPEPAYTSSLLMTVDSGTTLMYLPGSIAAY
jgi:hypothetical protein